MSRNNLSKLPLVVIAAWCFTPAAWGAEVLRLDFENAADLTEETSGSGLNGVITDLNFGLGNITQSTDVPSVSSGTGSASFTQLDFENGQFIEFLGAEFPDFSTDDDFTVSMWLKPSAAFIADGWGARGIVSGETATGIGTWQVDNGGTVDGGAGDGTTTFTRLNPTGQELVPGANLSSTQWTQVSISYIGASNAAVVSTRDELSSLNFASAGSTSQGYGVEDLLIGTNRNKLRLYDGLMDEVVVTDTAMMYNGSGVAFEVGDLNFSGGAPDAADYLLFRGGQGVDLSALTPLAAYGQGDMDFDGDNDLADFLAFRSAFGVAEFELLANGIPEPTSVALMMIGIAALGRWRHRVGRRAGQTPTAVFANSPSTSLRGTSMCRVAVFAALLVAASIVLSVSTVEAQITSASVDFDVATDLDDFTVFDGNIPALLLGDPNFAPLIAHAPTGGTGGTGGVTYDGTPGTNSNSRRGNFNYTPNGGTSADMITADELTLEIDFLADDPSSGNTPKLGITSSALGEAGIGGQPPPVDSLAMLLRTSGNKVISIRNSDATGAGSSTIVGETPSGGAFNLISGNWYRMSVGIVRTVVQDEFEITASVFDLGVTGTDTPNELGTVTAANIVNEGLYASGGFAGFSLTSGGSAGVVSAVDNFSVSTDAIVIPDPLTLQVFTDTGEMRLTNPNPTIPIEIDYLRLVSEDSEEDGGSLAAGSFTGLAGAPGFPAGNDDGTGWEAADNNDDTEIIESFLTGSSVITNAAGEISLGNAFVPGATEDLTFTYHITGEGAVETLGVIEYVTSPGLPGDFDGDNDVDGLDFLVWQRNDGTPAGLAAWEANYGNSLIEPSGSTAPVPEPTSAMICCLLACLAAATRPRHSACRAMYRT